MKDSPSTGIACICPELGYKEIASINPLASIYTAETTAIRMAIDLANQDHSKRKMFTSNTSHQIIRAKNSLEAFEQNTFTGNKIKFVWMPSHHNIPGNESADEAAKEAANKIHNLDIPIPYADITQLLKESMWHNTEQNCKKPWFYNKTLPRFITSWVCRYRANHYNLATSLGRIGTTKTTECHCGYKEQHLNHILWNCPTYRKTRDRLIRKLRQQGWTPPYKIEPFIQGPDIKAMAPPVKSADF
ncbi:uncharacterized protein LOC143175241 [Nomia melanderi]|uniref:uncharacterized protein LOC143175241 n=1 Tax=Nomia melanderi TaxID=2448451 RepID=UPI003FCCBE87